MAVVVVEPSRHQSVRRLVAVVAVCWGHMERWMPRSVPATAVVVVVVRCSSVGFVALLVEVVVTLDWASPPDPVRSHRLHEDRGERARPGRV